jgi:hypothetical protein
VTYCNEPLPRDAVDPDSAASRGLPMEWALRSGEGGAHCAEPPPSVKPAARTDPSDPSRDL